ncbi:GNAT family N-acetyltransferase [Sphingopyxis sp. LARHCG72]
MTPVIFKPNELSSAQRDEFIAMVHQGAQVSKHTLGNLVDRAVALVTIYDGDRLIGTAAIKDPNPDHRRGYFVKSGERAREVQFPLEMGWVVVHPDYRDQGLARSLIQAAISAAPNGMYATTKTDRILKILPEYGFIQLGASFPSAEDPNAELTLFVRDFQARSE